MQRHVRHFIEETAGRLGIKVEETDRLEPGHSGPLRPPFSEELRNLREAVPSLPTPHTVSFEDFGQNPFFPAMAKKTTSSRGKDKFVLAEPNQWSVFQEWAAHHHQGQLPDWIFQEFIDCPSERRTSYRVLVDCVGRIIASQLMYGPKKKDDPRVRLSLRDGLRDDGPEKALRDPRSPFFLNATDASSNLIFTHGPQPAGCYETGSCADGGGGGGGSFEASTPRSSCRRRGYGSSYEEWSGGSERLASEEPTIIGGRIVLNRRPQSHPVSSYEKQLLEAHDIDPDLPRLPKEIAAMSSAIGRHLGMKGAKIREMWFGLDWIQAKRGGFYFLEANRRPNLVSLRDLEGRVDAITELEAIRWLVGDVLSTAAEQMY